MDSEAIGAVVINSFLYLLLLSVIGSAVAQVFCEWFGINQGRAKRLISTVFCFIVVFGWKIGLFTLLFGDPAVTPFLYLGLDLKAGFFRFIDILGTAVIAGSGSGFVADTFKLAISKMKEWREIAKTNKKQSQQ